MQIPPKLPSGDSSQTNMNNDNEVASADKSVPNPAPKNVQEETKKDTKKPNAICGTSEKSKTTIPELPMDKDSTAQANIQGIYPPVGEAAQGSPPVNPGQPIVEKTPENLFQLAIGFVDRLGKYKTAVVALIIFFGLLGFVWSQIPEQGKLSIINRFTGEANPKAAGYYPSVEIDDAIYRVDLTEWTAVPPGGDASQSTKATFEDFLTVRRIRPEAEFLARRAATTGREPQFTSQTHSVSVQRAHDDRLSGPKMSRYDVLLNISKETVNSPFKAHLRSVRLGGFRDPDSEWTAQVVLQPVRCFTLQVQFPKNKPGKNFRLSASGHSDGKNYHPINGLGKTITRPREFNWTIEHPQIGFSYRVDWDW